MRTLVIGSRGSRLALWQSGWVRDRLAAAGHAARIVEIHTTGDRQRDLPLTAIGGRGVFVKEIEEYLADRRVDLAVHSLKDLPTSQPGGLRIVCVPEREDPRDLLVAPGAPSLASLTAGAVVGTGSPRRACQLLARRPDLKIKDLRGNIDTRIAKLRRGEYDAIVLARAGIKRLGLELQGSILEFEEMLPAVGQGALALEARDDDPDVASMTASLHHEATAAAVAAERAVLRGLGGGCQAPIAAYAEVDGNRLVVRALVADPAGKSVLRERLEGTAGDPESTGTRLARILLDRGAGEILSRALAAGPGAP